MGFVRELQCLLGARRLDESVAGRLQVPLEQAQDVRIIIDHQDRWHLGRWKAQAQADLVGRALLDVQPTTLHLEQSATEGEPRAIVRVCHGAPLSSKRSQAEIHAGRNVVGCNHNKSTGAGFDDPA